MFESDSAWFWVVFFGSLAINYGIYYFRAKGAPPTRKTFLRIGVWFSQAAIYIALILFTLPSINHFKYYANTTEEEAVQNFEQQEEQLKNVEADIGRIKFLIIGIMSCLLAGIMNVTREMPSKEAPIVLGLVDE